MKNLILLIILIYCSSLSIAQNIHSYRVQCDSTYLIRSILPKSNGTFLAVGSDVTDFSTQNQNGFVALFDSNYNIIWKREYGGTESDFFEDIKRINDNRFAILGESGSTDGDVNSSFPILPPTATAVWVSIVDSNGNLIRNTTYGYGGNTDGKSIVINQNGYIYLSGGTVWKVGDFINNPNDMFTPQTYIALMDTSLNKKWIKYLNCLYGEPNVPQMTSAINNNGNLILPVYASSVSGDFSGTTSLGSADILLFCIDTSQNILWKKRYGGNDLDVPKIIIIDSYQNIFLMGSSSSKTGDFFTNELEFDPNYPITYPFLSKMDSIGNIIWNHAYGKWDTTGHNKVQTTFISMTISESKIWLGSSVIKTDNQGWYETNYGKHDFWILQCDTSGILENKLRFGGPEEDWIYNLTALNKGEKVLLQGGTLGGAKNSFYCDTNYTVDGKCYELVLWPTGIKEVKNENSIEWSIVPNPSNGTIRVQFDKSYSGVISIYGSGGISLYETILKRDKKIDIDLHSLSNGVYYIVLKNEKVYTSKKIIIVH